MEMVCDTSKGAKFIKVNSSESIIFDATSLNETSDVFEVGNDGCGVLITGYDFHEESLSLLRVTMDKGSIPSVEGGKCNCKCASAMLTNVGIAVKDQVPGCTWELNKTNTLGVLTVPGFYQVQRKTTPGIISNGTVTIRTVSKEAIASIPGNLMFGSK